MSESGNSIMEFLTTLSPGAMQLIAIVSAVAVIAGYQYLFGERQPADANVHRGSAKSTPCTKAKVRPLGTSDEALKAHTYFKHFPVVTVASGVLLEGDDVRADGKLSNDVVDILREALNVSKVHIILHEDTKPGSIDEETLHKKLANAGLVGQAAGQIPSHRILPCTTTPGKVAIVRQIEPALHLEYDAAISTELSRFRQRVELLTPGDASSNLKALVARER